MTIIIVALTIAVCALAAGFGFLLHKVRRLRTSVNLAHQDIGLLRRELHGRVSDLLKHQRERC